MSVKTPEDELENIDHFPRTPDADIYLSSMEQGVRMQYIGDESTLLEAAKQQNIPFEIAKNPSLLFAFLWERYEESVNEEI